MQKGLNYEWSDIGVYYLFKAVNGVINGWNSVKGLLDYPPTARYENEWPEIKQQRSGVIRLHLQFILSAIVSAFMFAVSCLFEIKQYAKTHPYIFGITFLITLGIMLACVFFPPAAELFIHIPELLALLEAAGPAMQALWVLVAACFSAVIACAVSQLVEGIYTLINDCIVLIQDSAAFAYIRAHPYVFAFMFLATLAFLVVCIFFPPALLAIPFLEGASTLVLTLVTIGAVDIAAVLANKCCQFADFLAENETVQGGWSKFKKIVQPMGNKIGKFFSDDFGPKWKQFSDWVINMTTREPAVQLSTAHDLVAEAAEAAKLAGAGLVAASKSPPSQLVAGEQPSMGSIHVNAAGVGDGSEGAASISNNTNNANSNTTANNNLNAGPDTNEVNDLIVFSAQNDNSAAATLAPLEAELAQQLNALDLLIAEESENENNLSFHDIQAAAVDSALTSLDSIPTRIRAATNDISNLLGRARAATLTFLTGEPVIEVSDIGNQGNNNNQNTNNNNHDNSNGSGNMSSSSAPSVAASSS
ncbi:MAG TPA: hypothetical protein VI522_06280, partial [Gammaproteobacteria bacterium]|nr:hypothetical protein [Gammaproteobacteria bacterium]